MGYAAAITGALGQDSLCLCNVARARAHTLTHTHKQTTQVKGGVFPAVSTMQAIQFGLISRFPAAAWAYIARQPWGQGQEPQSE